MPKASKAILTCLVALAASAAGAAQITWLALDQPPGAILDGPAAGQGAIEGEGRVLARGLPFFDWRFQVARPLRILHEIEYRDGVCGFGFVKTPKREQAMLFNARPMPVPGYGIIVREGRLGDFKPLLDKTGSIDLGLLREGALTGGFVTGRAYPKDLKDFLDYPRWRAAPVSEADTSSLFRQLAAGRVDFLLALRDETAFFAETIGGARLASLPIAGADPFAMAHIACSAGPVGQKAMAAIDAWLADDRHWAEFAAPWQRWLSPEDYAAALRAHTNPVR